MENTSEHSYAHVDVHLKGRMRLLSSAEELPVFNGYAHDEHVLADLTEKTNLPDALVTMLGSMNAKLEYLVALLEQDKLEQDFPLTFDVCCLSASEFYFNTEASITPNSFVEVVLPLSSVPFRVAGGIGRVIKGNHKTFGKVWQLHFTRIRETDLENIVQFVFQQERKRIREVHWD